MALAVAGRNRVVVIYHNPILFHVREEDRGPGRGTADAKRLQSQAPSTFVKKIEDQAGVALAQLYVLRTVVPRS